MVEVVGGGEERKRLGQALVGSSKGDNSLVVSNVEVCGPSTSVEAGKKVEESALE